MPNLKSSGKLAHIIGNVTWLGQLRDEDGGYLEGTVDVVGGVSLPGLGLGLERLPVKFGAVSRHFSCGWNRLTSLEGAPSIVGGDFWCAGNRLTTLVGVHRILRRIDGNLSLWNNPIESGGIGLVLVEGLTEIYANHPAFGIINKYLGQGNKGLLRCQEELHEAGFGEFARL